MSLIEHTLAGARQRTAMLRYLCLSMGLVATLTCGCGTSHLVGSGTIGVTSGPAVPVPVGGTPARLALARLVQSRLKPDGQPKDDPPTERDSDDGETLLKAIFSPARDSELADIVVYFQDVSKPPLVFLMQNKKMRRVLDRETQAWVVILMEKPADTSCPKALLKLEGVGAAQLEAGV